VGDLRVPLPGGDQPQDVELPRSRRARVRAGRPPRAPWNRRAALAQPLPDAPSRRRRSEISHDRERLEERPLARRLPQRTSPLVGTAPRTPGACRILRCALQLEAPRLGDPLWPRIELTGPRLPVRKLAREPEVALLERERIRGPGLLGGPLGIACKPRRLRSRR